MSIIWNLEIDSFLECKKYPVTFIGHPDNSPINPLLRKVIVWINTGMLCIGPKKNSTEKSIKNQ